MAFPWSDGLISPTIVGITPFLKPRLGQSGAVACPKVKPGSESDRMSRWLTEHPPT